VKANDELAQIVKAINDLVIKIQDNKSKILLANEEIVKLDKMKSEFVSIASHELRTPIQPILSFAELGRSGKVKPERAFEEIRTQAIRLRRLANDILDVSKIEGGRFNLTREKVFINEMIEGIVSNTQ